MPNKAENAWGLTVEDVARDDELEQLLASSNLIPDVSNVSLGEFAAGTAFTGVVEFAQDTTDVPVALFQSSI